MNYKMIYLIVMAGLMLNTNCISTGITDNFYQKVNKEWFESNTLAGKAHVLNNWDILWKKVTDKSIEILSCDDAYGLKNKDLHNLNVLRCLYGSMEHDTEIRTEEQKVYYIQEKYPMYFGMLFAKITISDDKRRLIQDVITTLQYTFIEQISNTDRLGDFYKKFYTDKLRNIEFVIGAPENEKLPELPFFSIENFTENTELIEKHKTTLENFDYIKWSQGPFETSCFYICQSNSINLYAGLLIDLNEGNMADIPYVYSTLGRTIAHEMTHSIDHVGEMFDENGRYISLLRRFITFRGLRKNSLNNVRKKLVSQFSEYKVVGNVNLNSKIMMQENFADLSGFEIAYLAMVRFLREKKGELNEELKKSDSIKFYEYYAEFWREKATKEFELKTAERIHPPQKFRAIGVLYNQDLFYEYVKPDENDIFYIPKDKRIKVWQ